MRKKKKRNSASLRLLAGLLLAAATLAGPVQAQKRFQPYALIYVTVFYEENGFLVRGARVEVRLKDTKKRWDANTNEEGSAAIQVPAGKAVYVVESQISGRVADRKEISVENDERVDVVLHLRK
jgi:uncharacterized lipoprotein YbaY